MNELPKIVQQRLQMAQSGAHPEPDVLNAFVEKALPEAEQVEVLAHLSRCDECREVVFLAQPELQVSDSTAQRPSLWLRWPTVRWVTAAACVLVVGTAVSLRHGWQDISHRSAGAPSDSVASDGYAGKVGAEQKDQDRLTEPPTTNSASNEAPAVKVAGRQTVGLPPAAAEKKETMSAKNSVAAVPGPRPKEYRRGYSRARITPPPAMPMKPGQSENQANSGLRAPDELAPRPQVPAAAADTSDAPANAKKTSQWNTNQAMIAIPAVPALKWTLTSDGSLQRSTDSGKTWRSVPVANGVLLRAIASLGAEIWVGGAKGALYHSSDAGLHWVSFTPTVGGEPLTADITAIEFHDSEHGYLTTATREFWTTENGGQTWERR